MQPVTPEADWWSYIVTGALALLGSIARAGRWIDSNTGKFSKVMLFQEIAAAIVIGALSVGAGVYWGLPLPVAGALAGLGGLLGPAALAGATQSLIQSRIGGSTRGNSDKPSG